MQNAGFFAAGVDYQLPHPTIATAVLLVVHNAVRRAFAFLRDTEFPLGTAHEDQITRQLYWILEDHLRQTGEVPGFDERVFRKVWRGPEVTNFDGKHPAKKPDLVFELVRDETLVLSSQDALFVECKLVGTTHPVGSVYCNTGISRFIGGDYAWAMQEAMMLGYARSGYSILDKLEPILTTEPYHDRLGQPTATAPIPASVSDSWAEELRASSHNRDFNWPHGQGPAGKIRLFHSWHDCS
ncbi:MAG: hypothetical protein F4029_19235 [Gammaproteobacteria bacterium]|nr:hypothetical protein [Gammaproteobacteria bacterium]MYF29060.1 hypothetical protein [Gammaproteobacteria bacterium]MYK48348.1 hypothetical protein [Gammaproteobacteria bacterium]